MNVVEGVGPACISSGFLLALGGFGGALIIFAVVGIVIIIVAIAVLILGRAIAGVGGMVWVGREAVVDGYDCCEVV